LFRSDLDESLEELIDALQQTPNPNLISAISLFPQSPDCKIKELELDGKIIYLPLPYKGVSLGTDIQDAWSRIAANVAVIERYCFNLAASLQAALSEKTPTFADDDGLWMHILLGLAFDELSDSDFLEHPLLSLLGLESILRSCTQAGSAACSPEKLQLFQAKYDRLSDRVLAELQDKLLSISNGAAESAWRSAAAKLLIHLAESAQLEKIKGLAELSFHEEPVGENVIRKLKFIRSLEKLDLSKSYFPAESLRNLAYLPILRSLNLKQSPAANVSIINLSSCPALEEIDCSFTQVNDDGAKHFLSFRRLKRVVLTGAHVSPDMLNLLRQANLDVEG
ncbi:MAG: hypothetical protein K2X27_04225, partial [Candidatus Obscuribacterales bacterium]|nr:hypothetical protein [Candidatus Obscuribacterales bacterium]